MFTTDKLTPEIIQARRDKKAAKKATRKELNKRIQATRQQQSTQPTAKLKNIKPRLYEVVLDDDVQTDLPKIVSIKKAL